MKITDKQLKDYLIEYRDKPVPSDKIISEQDLTSSQIKLKDNIIQWMKE